MDIKSLNSSQQKVFFPSLDGLRFFAFFTVFFCHSFYTDIESLKQNLLYKFIKTGISNNAELGVSFFFVLSGFLITYLLLKEKKINGKINIKNFYIRRALRIWPLYYLCVFFGFMVFPILKGIFGQLPNETANLLPYLFFINNFDFLKHGADSSVLSILWSIAVEEQFYLIWPLILTFSSPKKYKLIFICCIISSAIFRILNINNPNPAYLSYHTLSVFSDLAIGGLAATLILNNENFFAAIQNIKSNIIYFIYVFIFAVIFFNQIIFTKPILIILKRFIVAPLFAFVILEQSFSIKSCFKISNLKLISTLGKYTYGLYCYHTIGILITYSLFSRFNFNAKTWPVILANISISLLLTILISLISYRYFESKFLKLKTKFCYLIKE